MRVSIDGTTVRGPDGTNYTAASAAQARYIAHMMRVCYNSGHTEGLMTTNARWKWGWLRNKGSMWIGVHYSKHNLRWCINLIPCVTFWITKPGGKTP